MRRIGTLCLVLLVSGCGFAGPNSLSLPFTEGRGEGAMTVGVQMRDAGNLVNNSEVKVGNVTVGSVKAIAFDDWHAKITVGLNPGTELPADALARIGQKSLLGAEYLEIAAPPGGGRGELADGAVIPLSRTGRYPGTEEVLAALSTLLNGGGLAQLRTITGELNDALGGKEANWRSLITKLNTFIGGLNAQRSDLVRLLKGMNRLGGTLAGQRRTLTKALDTIPAGLKTIEAERDELMDALEAVSDFGDALTGLIDRSQDDLIGNLRDLQPVLREVADAGKELPEALGIATFPFPMDGVKRVVKGDYANLFFHFDFTLEKLDRTMLTGTPLEGLLTGIGGVLPGDTESKDPLRAPLEPPKDLPNTPQRPSLPLPSLPGGEPSDDEPETGGILLPGLLNPASRGDG